VCNFDCIYCSVDRKVPLPEWGVRDVDLGVMREELRAMVQLVAGGGIYQLDPFDKIPATLQRLNDVAFSGDGEPTTCPQFGDAVRAAAEVVEGQAEARGTKLVLITNATMLHKPAVQEVLAFLDGHHGEIWAKLDAGTEAYYQLVDRTGVPLRRVMENLIGCCRERETVIQTLMMRVHGEAPPVAEVAAYCARLREILQAGGKIKLVQMYTVARGTTEAYATALSAAELESIAGEVRSTGLTVEIYP
jgi:wyosine [tRNA(Phe)-imidazoG37] synthetase (radical SAM superfamily)